MARGVKSVKLDWVHYPENDLIPEHYSSPYALLVREVDKWEVWMLTPALGVVTCAEEIKVEMTLGAYRQVVHAKQRVAEFVLGRRKLMIKVVAA